MKLFILIFACLSSSFQLSAACISEKHQFENQHNGAVLDKSNNLMWMQCTYGTQRKDNTCEGIATRLDWNKAMFRVDSINSISKPAGYNDWRLPSVEELQTLVVSNCYDPTIDEIQFPNTDPSGYWSSTKELSTKSSAYLVFFLNGSTYSSNKETEWNIRLVRNP